MENHSLGLALLIGLGVFGLLFLASRNNSAQAPIRLQPAGTLARRYVNEETWEIDWNEDGLPKKVTIHRDARES